MGTTDSASNPVACLRSNCVPLRGPTFFEYKGQDANRKALNRTSDGETTDPFDTPKNSEARCPHEIAHGGCQATFQARTANRRRSMQCHGKG